MPAKTQLIGGNFQDLEGNVLANGYFTMRLNQDETVNDSQVCSGIIIRIQLDSTGNVATTSSTPPVTNQFVWANDIMVPVNSYYTVTVYSAAGQIVWGPNNQQVSSGGVGGGTFDVGTWTPNTVISWTPSAQLVEFEVAGVPLSSQTTVDFVNIGNVTFTDEGGGQISASAGGSSSLNVADLPWQAYQDQAGIPASAQLATAGNNFVQIMFANSIVSGPTSWKVMLYIAVAVSAPIVEFCLIRTLRNSLTTVDVTPITFGGSHTPTFSVVGPVTSDAISLPIDALHDHYFCFAGNAFGGSGDLQTSFVTSENNVYCANPDTGGNALSSLWASSIGAGGGFNGAFPNGGPGEVGFFLAGWVSA